MFWNSKQLRQDWRDLLIFLYVSFPFHTIKLALPFLHKIKINPVWRGLHPVYLCSTLKFGVESINSVIVKSNFLFCALQGKNADVMVLDATKWHSSLE